jgi:hypothetical protein
MPSWVPRIVRRIRGLSAAGNVRFSYKALYELAALELGIDQDDVLHLLQHLEAEECFERLRSAITNEWICVFKPTVASTVLYIKVAIRQGCIVVSLHEDEEKGND